MTLSKALPTHLNFLLAKIEEKLFLFMYNKKAKNGKKILAFLQWMAIKMLTN